MRSNVVLKLTASLAVLGIASIAIAQTPAAPTPPAPGTATTPPTPPAASTVTPPVPPAPGTGTPMPMPPAAGKVSGPPLPTPGSTANMPMPPTGGSAGGPPLPTPGGAGAVPLPAPANAKSIPPPTPVKSDKPETFPEKVTTLISRDRAIGNGDAVVTGQAVAVHYTGWLYDPSKPDGKGVKFDSSLTPPPGRPPLPFNFMLGANRVIKGWDQGVVGMKPRGQRTLIIPSDMAYGPGGRGPIPPNATLIFDVELLDALNPPPPKAAGATAAPVAPPAKQ